MKGKKAKRQVHLKGCHEIILITSQLFRSIFMVPLMYVPCLQCTLYETCFEQKFLEKAQWEDNAVAQVGRRSNIPIGLSELLAMSSRQAADAPHNQEASFSIIFINIPISNPHYNNILIIVQFKNQRTYTDLAQHFQYIFSNTLSWLNLVPIKQIWHPMFLKLRYITIISFFFCFIWDLLIYWWE